MGKKVALIILDGWGQTQENLHSAIAQAKTPFIDSLYRDCPNTTLEASGLSVGLPKGQMGNSEVGHLTLGAGRVVRQSLERIHHDISQGHFFHRKSIVSFFQRIKETQKDLHLIGLLSDGGVHSHIEHFEALIDTAFRFGLSEVFLHAFSDGRDTNPKGILRYVERAQRYMETRVGKLSSLIGRYYAMDRDLRWERTQKAYQLLVNGTGENIKYTEFSDEVLKNYHNGITDEFLGPIKFIEEDGSSLPHISEGDAVIFFNFRTDRGRQLSQALTQKKVQSYEMNPLALDFATLTSYDDSFRDVHVFFESQNISDTLGEVLARHQKQQTRIAETEKYPHVTFFFSGGREEAFDLERRILCPSPQVATYDLKPEMSAFEVEKETIKVFERGDSDFICVNFANPDMVGHTGVFSAVVRACEVVDICLSRVVDAAIKNEYILLVLADHGNAEYMIQPDGSPHTAHTTHPVPFFLIGKKSISLRNGGTLADVAPTILDLMQIPLPLHMTGRSLIVH